MVTVPVWHIVHSFTDWTASVTDLDRTVKATHMVTVPVCHVRSGLGQVWDRSGHF